MERLQIDFAMQRGHEMIIRRAPPFVRAELDEVDLQMLQAERPPGLLAVDWFEMDGNVTFRYAIDGRKMLPHRLITGPFGMDDYLSLLLGIVEALDHCGHYLLRDSCCLLEEKFLYIGGDWRDIALAYLPLREPPARKPVREELLGLAVRLIGKVERVDGDAMQTMLRLLDDPAATWSGVRVGLLEMLAPDRRSRGDSPDGERAAYVPNVSVAGRPDMGAHPSYSSEAVPRTEPESPPVAQARPSERTPADRADRMAGASGEPDPEGGERQSEVGKKSRFDSLGRFFRGESSADVPPPETMMFDEREWPGTTGRMRDTGRARWLSACGAVLAVALIWRYLYLPAPGTERLLISLGATLLAVGGLFLLWQRLTARDKGWLEEAQSAGGAGEGLPDSGSAEGWRPEPEPGAQGVAGGLGNQTAVELRFPWLTEFARNNDEVPHIARVGQEGSGEAIGSYKEKNGDLDRAMAHPVRPNRDVCPAGPDDGPANSAGPDGDETGWLEDETVLLGRDGDGAIWLVREYEGTHRRIPVEPGVQVIGRSDAHARIVDTAEGVSRAHLEVACEGGEVRIKDLASRNGTLLEGEIMIPYKEYALPDGGTFRLAGPDGPKYTLRKKG